jgi:serine/threonine-protein phosphatase 2A regulatory subunit B''
MPSLKEMPSARLKLNDLFVEWLLQDSNPKIIEFLHDEGSFGVTGDGPDRAISILDSFVDKHVHAGPPRSPSNKSSPKKRTQADMLSYPASTTSRLAVAAPDTHRQTDSADSDAQKQAQSKRRSNIDAIPPFYSVDRSNPNAAKSHYRIFEDALSNRLHEIEAEFKPFPGGIGVENFVQLTKNLCGFPSFFNKALFQRIMEYYSDDNNGKLTLPRKVPISIPIGAKLKLKAFLTFWQLEIEPYDNYGRFFRLVKNPNSDFIRKDDFVPFILELLLLHPGLDFLASHEEFKRKYALTVIARIFYKVNLSRTGKITCREVRRSNLVQEFMHVDEETDINRCVEYFSYEHFYVLYCRFFELDADKDAKISSDDLMKYGDYCLSEPIIER